MEHQDLTKPGSMSLIVRADPGDNYAKIANQFGVSEADLRAANPGIKVKPGAQLVVPLIPAQCVTEDGDTLESVAAQFDTTPGKIREMNPTLTTLTPGTVLNLP